MLLMVALSRDPPPVVRRAVPSLITTRVGFGLTSVVEFVLESLILVGLPLTPRGGAYGCTGAAKQSFNPDELPNYMLPNLSGFLNGYKDILNEESYWTNQRANIRVRLFLLLA